MTSLKVTTKSYVGGDPSWLGSEHGLDSTETITVTTTGGITLATHAPNGFLPSGTALGKISASGKYGLYDNAASDGREVLVGHLYGDLTMDATGDYGAAMLTHGKVREANLPQFTGTAGEVDSAGKTDVAGRIRYI